MYDLSLIGEKLQQGRESKLHKSEIWSVHHFLVLLGQYIKTHHKVARIFICFVAFLLFKETSFDHFNREQNLVIYREQLIILLPVL